MWGGLTEQQRRRSSDASPETSRAPRSLGVSVTFVTMCGWLPPPPQPVQTTLELGVPLSEVTFCVVDLETTGGSPTDDAITEIGAVKFRGGERLGSFQSLVNPRRPIPPYVAHLTGIDDRLVSSEPPIEQVLPAFLEFFRGSVFVAHNARFDFGFLNAGCDALEYPALPGPPVCTARLARRVVWPDVPNVKLQTLANYFRTRAKPTHRALDDAEACAEVLHGLLDLGGRLGILSLGDLEAAVRARGRPNFGKIRLADHLPHAPGVYLFRGRDGRVLYVGKANDLRARVKSYFYGDERKKIANLLDEVRSVEGIRCHGELEALVVEARLIRRHEPKYNRRGKTWRRGAYLAIDPAEAWPRVKVVRAAEARRRPPLPRPVRELGPRTTRQGGPRGSRADPPVHDARCAPGTRFAPCALADMGRCVAPCDGRTDPERYGELVRWLASSLSTSPGELLEALERRMSTLADAERFEEAASVRDRLRALAEGTRRSRSDAWLIGAGRLELRHEPDQVLCGSITARSCANAQADRGPKTSPTSTLDAEALVEPCPRERVDELAAVRSWIATHHPRVDGCDRRPAEPVEGGATLARVLDRTARRLVAAVSRGRRRARRLDWRGMERAVIVEGARTPIGKFLGSFAETPAVQLGELAAREALRRAAVEPDQIEQTIVGHARQAGNGPNTGRQVSMRAGVPEEVGAYNVNIACGSGMKATQLGAQQIMLGESEVVLVGGIENMTRVPYLLPDMRLGHRLGNTEVVDAMYRDGLLDPICGLIMGETAENLVDMYDISREEQDEFALESQRKAQAGGERRAAEMFPVEATLGRQTVTVADDEHPRPDASIGGLGEARPRVPRRRQRHGRQLERTHRRRRGARAHERVASARRGATDARRHHRHVVGRRAARDHGHRARAGHPEGHGPAQLHDRRLRAHRDQRGVRGAGHRVRARVEVRPRPTQRERRRHLGRASDRHERSAHHRGARLRDARARPVLGPGDPVHLGRPGPRRRAGAHMKIGAGARMKGVAR